MLIRGNDDGALKRKLDEEDDRLGRKRHTIITIVESKGLEEKYICLYGFFGGISDITTSDDWKKALNPHEDKKIAVSSRRQAMMLLSHAVVVTVAISR